MADTDDGGGRREQLARVGEFFDSKVDAIGQVLRAEVAPEAFLSVVKSAVSRNPDLLECVPMTLYGAVYDAAKLGLDVDPRTGEFWLIPRRNRHMNNQMECTGMIGYKGFITLGRRAGVIEKVETRVVYRDEVANGLVHINLATSDVNHEWSWSEDIDRSDAAIVGAYCTVWLPGIAQPIVEPLTREMIEKRMRSSGTQLKKGRPWHDWFPEMCRKTTVRAMFGRGYFPLTSKIREAPAKITIETPHLSLADALEADDRWAEQRKELAAPTDVETVEVPETDEPVAVAAGEVFEEGKDESNGGRVEEAGSGTSDGA